LLKRAFSPVLSGPSGAGSGRLLGCRRQQPIGVHLDREPEHASEADPLRPGRRDAPDQLGRHRDRLSRVQTIERRLHLRRVPGHHEVREQPERIADRGEFLVPLRLETRDASGVDRALDPTLTVGEHMARSEQYRGVVISEGYACEAGVLAETA